MSNKTERLQKALADRILILDGAMGTMIQRHALEESHFRGTQFADWHCDIKGNNDLLAITQPQIIKGIHAEYLAAGADIVETNTFNATKISQADYDMEEHAYAINVAAAKLAREACDEAEAEDGRPRFVAGVIGPTSRSASISPDVNDPGFRNVKYEELVADYTESLDALVKGDIDIVLIETVFDTLNAKAAVYAVKQYFSDHDIELPIMVSGTITDASGRTLSGQTTEAFYNSMAHANAQLFGLNCALGPDMLRPYVEEISRVAECHITIHPNAGLPNEFGEYDLGPEDMAEQLGEWADAGFLNVIGGCCGTTPEHIAAIAKVMEYKTPRTIPSFTPRMRLSGLEPFNVA